MLVNLEIKKTNLEKNLKIARSINENLICVIKDNAYGLGIENILPILLENKCDYFAVAYIEETLKIQEVLENLKLKNQNNKIKVMTLNYVKPENVEYAIKNNIELTVFNFSQLLDYLKILDDFSQQLLVTLADVEAIKKNLKSLVEENTALRLENSKLRERLGEVEADTPVKAKHVRESVRRIYKDGFHVCNDFYGQRREQDEECMFCDELLYRE
ncbi:MAG: DNA replication initiation control protein YabA [Leptotrichia wadei]